MDSGISAFKTERVDVNKLLGTMSLQRKIKKCMQAGVLCKTEAASFAGIDRRAWMRVSHARDFAVEKYRRRRIVHGSLSEVEYTGGESDACIEIIASTS